MATLAKLNGVEAANIAKINGAAAAGLAKWNGLDWPADTPPGDPGYWEFTVVTTTTPQNFSIDVDDTVNLLVDWGDSSNNTYNGDTALTRKTHSYASPGTYAVRISGQASKITFYNTGTAGLVKSTQLIGGIGGLTNFQRMFQGTDITEIPDWMFYFCSGATTFDLCFFQVTSIVEPLPKHMFWGTGAATMSSVIRGCTGIPGGIPSGFLQGVTGVSTFNQFADGCTGLNGTIPAGLFTDTGATIFSSAFLNCNLTGTIPDFLPNSVTNTTSCFDSNLFTGIDADLLTGKTALTTAGRMFAGYRGSSIPSDLFADCALLANLNLMWYNAVDLISIPSTLYDSLSGVATNVGGLHRGNTALTGQSYKFWNWGSPPATTDDCYRDCAGLADYGTIPGAYL